MASFQLICHVHFYRNRTRFRIHRPSVENSLVLIVASVKYNRRSVFVYYQITNRNYPAILATVCSENGRVVTIDQITSPVYLQIQHMVLLISTAMYIQHKEFIYYLRSYIYATISKCVLYHSIISFLTNKKERKIIKQVNRSDTQYRFQTENKGGIIHNGGAGKSIL